MDTTHGLKLLHAKNMAEKLGPAGLGISFTRSNSTVIIFIVILSA